MYSLIHILPEVNNLCCFNALLLYSEVNNSCDTVLQVCNTQCKIHVSSMDLLHFCSVLSLMLFRSYYLDCLFTNYYYDGLYTVYYAICYVINCIEVLVMTSIVGECWRIIIMSLYCQRLHYYPPGGQYWLHSQ